MNNKKLYIASSGKYYKIGISEDPDKRIQQLNTANPEGVELIASFDTECAEATEHEFHKAFAARRVNGEWFNVPESYIEFIIDLGSDVPIDEISAWLTEIHPMTFMVLSCMSRDIQRHDFSIFGLQSKAGK